MPPFQTPKNSMFNRFAFGGGGQISQVDSSIYFTLGLLIGKLMNSGIGRTKIYLLSNDEGFDPSSHEILTVYMLLKGLVKVVPFQVVGDKVEITERDWLDLL